MLASRSVWSDIFTSNPGSWKLAADMLHTYHAICLQTQLMAASVSSPVVPHISLRISVNSEYSCDSAIPSPIELFITSHAYEPITVNVKDTIFDTTDWRNYLRIVHTDSSLKFRRNMTAGRPRRLWSSGRNLLDYGSRKRVPDTGDERPPHLVTLHPGIPLQLPVGRTASATCRLPCRLTPRPE